MRAYDTLASGILFTDMYQLTMAQLYYRYGLHQRPAMFEHTFRSYPDYGDHKAGYAVAAGLEWFLDWVQSAAFGAEEIEVLRSQVGVTGRQLFSDDFLEWLRANGDFSGLTIHAIPEGRVVHAGVPLTVCEGPLAMAQIVETALLNQINYQTLIATKAARIYHAGRGRLLLEFGMRRGHERGVNAGTRAALIGGAHYSSNLGISAALGSPPKGTHAHSMVQAFMALGEGELGAFRAYADVYPDDCLLLVDTVDTLESGVPNAITVFEELRRKGRRPLGIRLDSGDLAYLSIRAAKMLDDAGFPEAGIVLSNQMDELTIWQILTQIGQEARSYGVDPDALANRLIYGVGTSLITSAGDSALDGVYKLVAIADQSGEWTPAIKISETPEKTPNPGRKRVWRLYDRNERATADLICLEDEEPAQEEVIQLRHPTHQQMRRTLRREQISRVEPLLEKVLEGGAVTYGHRTIDDMRRNRIEDVSRLDEGVKRLINPHVYHVSLSESLWQLKQQVIREARRG